MVNQKTTSLSTEPTKTKLLPTKLLPKLTSNGKLSFEEKQNQAWQSKTYQLRVQRTS